MFKLISLIFIIISPIAAHAEDEAVKHGFYEAAEEYRTLAQKFTAYGKHDIAADYLRLAEIKMNAGKLGDADRWDEIDWSEYHQIETRLNQHQKQ